MRRRGFLGGLVGAFAAGPGMAKQAAADMLTPASLGLPGLASPDAGHPSMMPPPGSPMAPLPFDMADYAHTLDLLIGRSPEQHALLKSRQGVYNLDPDLASYRSFALGTKIAMQRERDYWRGVEAEKRFLAARLAGWHW